MLLLKLLLLNVYGVFLLLVGLVVARCVLLLVSVLLVAFSWRCLSVVVGGSVLSLVTIDDYRCWRYLRFESHVVVCRLVFSVRCWFR